MTRHLPDQLLARLSEFVTERFGLHFPRKRWHDLERRLCATARELGFKDTGECLSLLLASRLTPEQLEVLVRQLTIGETYFFREQKSFELLEGTILPELIAARRGKEQRLRLWSAGCSTGEEPYSLAILLSRLIPDLKEWNVTILATDLNPQAIGKATRGVYSDWSFRGTPPWLRERYFSRHGERGFAIAEPIRKMVTFACLNLAEETYPSLLNNTNAMDVIFCRNVLMYFEAEQARRVVGSFHRALLEGGWLVVSPCETSHLLFREYETVSFTEAILYRKNGVGRSEPPLPSPAEVAKWQPPPPPEQPPPPAAIAPLPPPLPTPAAEAATEPSPYEEALELYSAGRYGETAAKLARFLEGEGPADTAALPYGKAATLLAQALANQGRLGEALRWSEEAIAAAKLDPQLHYLRATIFQERGDTAEAVASLKRALYLDHDFALAHFALGNLTLRQGKKREAQRHFANAQSLLESHPAGETLPGAEGMTVGRLAEIIGVLRVSAGGQ